MPRPKCDRCERPATIHETVVGAGAGGPLVRNFCRVHGARLWADALPPVATRDDADLRRTFDRPGRGPSHP
jgi:hypothetical protein